MRTERVAPALIKAWPRDTGGAQRAFELPRRAYVDARHSPHHSGSSTFGQFSDLTKPGAEAILAAEWAAWLEGGMRRMLLFNHRR